MHCSRSCGSGELAQDGLCRPEAGPSGCGSGDCSTEDAGAPDDTDAGDGGIVSDAGPGAPDSGPGDAGPQSMEDGQDGGQDAGPVLCPGPHFTPTAIITVKVGGMVQSPTEAFAPFTSITLDGTGSMVPSGSGETITGYQWSLISEPRSGAGFLSGSGSAVALLPELIGEYVLQLVVTTNDQCRSEATTVTLNVASSAGIFVQLTWPETHGDLDLHYIGPGGSFSETTPYVGDLDWMNSLASAVGPVVPTANCGGVLGSCSALSPDWGGTPGVAPDHTATDDAIFFVDQRWGSGPESFGHPMPFAGTYKVEVHYYCSYANEDPVGASAGPATAELQIFVSGTLVWSGQMPGMTDDEVWDAADIVVGDGGTPITVNPLSTPLSYGGNGCSPHSGAPDAGAADAGGGTDAG